MHVHAHVEAHVSQDARTWVSQTGVSTRMSKGLIIRLKDDMPPNYR